MKIADRYTRISRCMGRAKDCMPKERLSPDRLQDLSNRTQTRIWDRMEVQDVNLSTRTMRGKFDGVDRQGQPHTALALSRR